MTTQETGINGEETAAVYLMRQRYDVRERNVRFGRYEIDIVAYDRTEKMMVFVEVKARIRHSDAYPIRTAVDARKRRAMRQAIARWTQKHQYDGPGRIDILSVSGPAVIEHLKDLGSDFF